MSRWRVAAAALGFALLALLAVSDLVKHGTFPWRGANDLPAFYCAGSAVRHGHNPYAIEPLLQCEHRADPSRFSNDPSTVLPAPLPPFDFPPYALLSVLTYPAAKIVVSALIAASAVVAAFALADLGIPLAGALAALAMADAFVGMNLGQIYPFTLMLAVLSAAALHRRRYALAGVLAALTLIEPALGAAICVVTFVWEPRMRIALLASAFAMLVAGMSVVGPHVFVQWATQVIPAMARAETSFYGQYSLTSILSSAGLGAGAALLIGNLAYACAVAFAAWSAKRLADRSGREEHLVLVPAALAVIFGTYVHIQAIAAAIPLALAFAATHDEKQVRWNFALPLILLAIPWSYVQSYKPVFFACMLVAVVVLVAFRSRARYGVALVAGAAALAYLIAVRTPVPERSAYPLPIPSGSAAELASSYYSPPNVSDPLREIAKLPTWVGLMWLFGLTARCATRKSAMR